LVYGLGCLKILQEDNTELTVTECWKIFCMADPTFISMYAAYHYYRTHKWIPKSGLKYGVDFVLYSGGVSLQHAQYGVIIKSIDAACTENGRSLSWATFSHITRLAEHVAKGIVLCHVVHPPVFDVDKLVSPIYLERLEIIETVLDRWQPAQTR